MATEKWVVVQTHHCEVIGREAQLLERRIYPAEQMPDMEPFRVLEKKCSAAIECNLKGCTCKWSFTGAEVDRFALT